MNTDIRIAILTLSRGIIQSKADPLRREKLCPNLLSPKFADAQMSSNFLPKFFVLKYIEPKVLAHKFLNTKVLIMDFINSNVIYANLTAYNAITLLIARGAAECKLIQ